MAIEKANLPSEEVVTEVRSHWGRVALKYSTDEVLLNDLFAEIRHAYQARDRYYHNLNHIQALLSLSARFRDDLQDKDIVDLAIFYHDIVYSPTRGDNEKRSAEIAVERLTQLQFSPEKIPVVIDYINATKSHQLDERANSKDIAWFLDFDLSILGADPVTYRRYANHVRLEYRVYPDVLYNRGRRKFLQETLQSQFIFNTSEFRTSFEPQARENMTDELKRLL